MTAREHRLDSRELEIQVISLLRRLSLPVGVQAASGADGRLDLTITLVTHLPRPYLNLVFRSRLEGEQLRLQNVDMGLVTLPGQVVEWMLQWLPEDFTQLYVDGPSSQNVAQRNPHRDSPGSPLSPILASKPRLTAYTSLIGQWSLRQHYSASLVELLRPLFQLARQRSTSGNATAENRALLQVTATYVNRSNPAQLFNLESTEPIRFITLRLHRRYDLAQHFLLAAAIASYTTEQFAASMGLYKELADTRHGSGFSFSDLVADKAGARFGRFAVSPEKARHLQEVMAQARNETLFMPDVRGMPDHLGRKQFELIFGNPDSTTYHRILKVIDKKIAGCSLYRPH